MGSVDRAEAIMRVAYVVTLLVIISCLASSDRDYAELSDALAAEEQVLAPTFSKIPFFALRHKAKSAKAKKMADCQHICDHKPNKGKNACRSFSYSVRKAECLWSPHKLSFNGKFVFYSKREKKGPGPKKYRDFPGLMYQAKDWTRYRTETSLDCENMCDKAKDSAGRTCHGYSYKEDDKTCLLSPFGLHYDLDYDYYERDPRAKMVIVKKKKVSKSGKVKKIKIKKKKIPPLDRKMKVPKKDKPVQQTGEYKTNLAMQEGRAKSGAKELAKKQKYAKKTFKRRKKAPFKFAIMKKEKVKAKKDKEKAAKKAKEMGVKKRKAIQKALREKTKKKFEVLRQKQREADRKKKAEAGVKLRKMQAKMQEKMKKELVYKTKRKEIQIKTEKHAKSNRKKIDGLVRSGTNLAAAERRNKKDGNGAKEDAAKEKVIKINVKRVKGRRHARHQRAYAKFVKKTLQKQLKKLKTDKQVAIAMKGMMKQRKAELGCHQTSQEDGGHRTLGLVEHCEAKGSGQWLPAFYQHLCQERQEGTEAGSEAALHYEQPSCYAAQIPIQKEEARQEGQRDC